MIYAYARVSTKEQNLDRQLEEFKKLNIDKIYSEKQSGKDFNSRKIYQSLKKKIVSGDTLIIMSIDRLGRNYQEILDEWRYLTEKKNIDIQVLDMPILNTNNNVSGLDGKFISNLILLIQAYTSQKEREKIKERQMEGIRIAKEKGVKLGRPIITLPENSQEIINDYLSHKITNVEAFTKLGISRGTFFKLLRAEEKPRSKYSKECVCYFKDGNKIVFKSINELSKYLYCSNTTITNFMKGKHTCLNDKIDKIIILKERK